MVQHDEGHVLRMLGHVLAMGFFERELEADDAARIVIAHRISEQASSKRPCACRKLLPSARLRNACTL
jgi:hypothetical protein